MITREKMAKAVRDPQAEYLRQMSPAAADAYEARARRLGSPQPAALPWPWGPVRRKRIVPPDGFFVVEDGCVDIKPMRMDTMRLGSKGLGPLRRKRWPHAVLPAVSDWLASPAGNAFVVRRDLELYGITCHPGGVLQHRHASATAVPDRNRAAG